MLEHSSNGGPASSNSVSRKLPRRPEETLPQMRYEWGSLDIDTFIQKLREDEGIAEAKVEQNSNGYIIHLVSISLAITMLPIFSSSKGIIIVFFHPA